MSTVQYCLDGRLSSSPQILPTAQPGIIHPQVDRHRVELQMRTRGPPGLPVAMYALMSSGDSSAKSTDVVSEKLRISGALPSLGSASFHHRAFCLVAAADIIGTPRLSIMFAVSCPPPVSGNA